MSLQDLHAQMLWDAASKGGSQADIARRYNEALQYLLGDQLHKMAVQSNGGLMGMNPVRGAARSGSTHAGISVGPLAMPAYQGNRSSYAPAGGPDRVMHGR